MGFNVKDTMVSYKSAIENAFIFMGKEPLSEDLTIGFHDLEQPNQRLTLRCRHSIQNNQNHSPIMHLANPAAIFSNEAAIKKGVDMKIEAMHLNQHMPGFEVH